MGERAALYTTRPTSRSCVLSQSSDAASGSARSIETGRTSTTVLGLQLAGELVQERLAAGHRHDVEPLGGELPGELRTQALRSAGDERPGAVPRAEGALARTHGETSPDAAAPARAAAVKG